jgi:hypothetical protein
VDEVIASGGTALAKAAEPVLGQAGYWLMSVTALFATTGATNAGLYPAAGLSENMVETRQFPPVMARKVGGRAHVGLLLVSGISIALVVGFDLSSIASIGSAVALCIFGLVTAGHLRVRRDTGANPVVLWIALLSTLTVLVTFIFTTLIHEPASIVTLVAILVVSAAIDFIWKRNLPATAPAPAAGAEPPSP